MTPESEMSVFDFADYKTFIRAFVAAQPHKGRGQYSAMALHLRVHSSLLSHIFRGPKQLTPEQACGLADYLKLADLQADYLIALVEHARAGSISLERTIARRLTHLREQHQQLEYRVPGATVLDQRQQSIFYSHWYYSAIRLAASLEDSNGAPDIARRLNLTLQLVEDVLVFLTSVGLLAKQGERYCLATHRTHIGSRSSLAVAHHRNWRNKAIGLYDQMTPEDFVYSAAIVVSKKDLKTLREMLIQFVEKATNLVEPSASETLAVLNLDLLEM